VSILYKASSNFQEIILEKSPENELRLTLSGDLQFSSFEEQLYHRAITDWPLEDLSGRENLRVLVLGGGDGLVVRNLLRYPNVSTITLIDIDAEVVNLAKNQPELVALNEGSFHSPKVKIIIADAFEEILKMQEKFDFIVADFPDPHTPVLGNLHTVEFYATLGNILAPGGYIVFEAPNVIHTRESYSCIVRTIGSIFSSVLGYSEYIPSFGELGFVIASQEKILSPSARIREIPFSELPPTDTANLANNLAYKYFAK
jgi:spermidine synthase